jgi:hypothetical protein
MRLLGAKTSAELSEMADTIRGAVPAPDDLSDLVEALTDAARAHAKAMHAIAEAVWFLMPIVAGCLIVSYVFRVRS